MIDLAVETGFGQFFIQPLTSEDPERILPFLRHPAAVMTFSDSGAHVSQVIDSSIQTHLLGLLGAPAPGPSPWTRPCAC